MLRFLLISHVAAGSIALICAFGSIATKKGSVKHIYLGRIYVVAMAYVVIGASVISVFRPNPFLFSIALFSGYLVWTGYRRARFKLQDLNKVDIITVQIGKLIVLILFGYGTFLLVNGENLGAVLIIFGIVTYLFVREDAQALKVNLYKSKYRIASHLQRMLGGTIATITAVLVQQVVPRIEGTSIPEFVVWLAPTIVISPLITYWSRKILTRK
jgi:hypothetical protein